jgi:hypothetical protein
MQEFERVGSVDGHRTIEVFEGLRAYFGKSMKGYSRLT